MKLIDSEELLKLFGKKNWSEMDDEEWDDLKVSIRLVKRRILDMPTIDAVPVVRCVDCKWYGRADKRRFYRGMDCLQKRICGIVPDKDFCSRAERRDDAE